MGRRDGKNENHRHEGGQKLLSGAVAEVKLAGEIVPKPLAVLTERSRRLPAVSGGVADDLERRLCH